AVESDKLYVGYNAAGNGLVEIVGGDASWKTDNAVYAGHKGTGEIRITGGGTLTSSTGLEVGDRTGSSGRLVVDGTNSTLALGGNITVGDGGTGELLVRNGATVNAGPYAYIGNAGGAGTITVDGGNLSSTRVRLGNNATSLPGTMRVTNGGKVTTSSGVDFGFVADCGHITATVDGADSVWTSYGLSIGTSGEATLTVFNQGMYETVAKVTCGANGTLNIEVSNNDMVDVGSEFANSGTVRFSAQPGLAGGTYTPITAASWSIASNTVALGGVWDGSAHEFTVSDAAATSPGVQAGIDPSTTQRIAVGGGLFVGVQPTASSATINLTATATGGALLTALQAALSSEEYVQGSFDYAVSGDGYTAGDEVSLSYKAEGTWDDVKVWHHDGSAWSELEPDDLRVGGGWVSFTADADPLGSYAVTSSVKPAKPAGTIVILR
ncbi:MAG: hypothetical protein JXB13_20290, partial [Phycisphaerae bacterium]|nr:hypothetical protein [Phycisphaerae bacterium]